MANKSYHELTEEEWKIVERELPAAKSTGRPQTDNRLAFNGILWILKSGAPCDFYLPNTANGTASTRNFDNGQVRVFLKLSVILRQNAEKYLLLIRRFAKCIAMVWERVGMRPDMRQCKILILLAAAKRPKSMSLSMKTSESLNFYYLPGT